MSGFPGTERRKTKRYSLDQEIECHGAREVYLQLQAHIKMDEHILGQVMASVQSLDASTKQAHVDINSAIQSISNLVIKAAISVILVLGSAFVALLVYIWTNRNFIVGP